MKKWLHFGGFGVKSWMVLLPAVVIVVALLGAFVYAQTSTTLPGIPITGYAADSQGSALNGVYTMEFDVYDAATGGDLLETETKSVTVSNGQFSTDILGGTDLDFDVNYYVEIKITKNGETETLSPRMRLSSAAYSHTSERVLGGISAEDITGMLSVSQIPDLSAGKITSGTFGTDRIPDLPSSKILGQLSASQIPALSATKITSGQFDSSRIASNAITRSKVDFIASGSGTYSNGNTVNYGKTFSVPPVVVCSAQSSGYICSIAAIGTTSFTVNIYDYDGNARSSPINWIAIGS